MTLELEKEKQKASKKITMIYAGQSEADNPAHFACTRLQGVFQELGLEVLYKDLAVSEEDEVIAAIAESAGVAIGLTVEWYGIGYPLQRLLDQCYLRKKEEIFTGIPLLAIVFSREGFEREAAVYLENAWQLLGGSQGIQVTAIFADSADLAGNFEALQAIEKKAEQFFRYHLHQSYALPQSFSGRTVWQEKGERAGDKPVPKTAVSEAERLQRQKEMENIQLLSSKLMAKLEEKTKTGSRSLPELLMEKYSGYTDKEYQMQIEVTDKPALHTTVLIKKSGIFAAYGTGDAPVTIRAEEEAIRRILSGKMSFQKAFMTGEITAKGELTVLYQLDDLFQNKNR